MSTEQTQRPFDIADQLLLTGNISPAALVANTNNWTPTGLAKALVIRATASAAVNITGLTGGDDGRIIAIYNIGTTNPITLTDNDVASAADNRFDFGKNIILAPSAGVILIYDDVPAAGSKRWRALGLASQQLNIDKLFAAGVSVFSGNVGIGVTPTQLLHIEGVGPKMLFKSSTALSPEIQFDASAGANEQFSFRIGGTQKAAIGFESASGDIFFWVNGNFRLRITDTGSVVIGGAAHSGTAQSAPYLYTPTVPGIPTGTPTTKSGREPFIINDTDDRFNFRASGAWHELDPTAILNQFFLPGDITPSSLSANQNNYTPSGAYSTASTVRQSSSANVDITGLTGGSDGRIMIVHNIGTFTITLKNQNGSSTAANRFALNADIILGANNAAVLQYDSTSSRWRAIASSVEGSGGGGAPTGASYVVIALDGTLTAERRLQVGTGLVLTDGGANGDVTIKREVIVDVQMMGPQMDTPADAAWTGSGGVSAPSIPDEDDLDIDVVAYDDGTEEGRGFDLFIPPNVGSIRFTFISRRRTSTGGATGIKPELHRKKYPNNAAPDSNFTAIGGSGAFTKLDMPASVEHYQYDTQTISISDLGVLANTFYNFELTRNVGHADDDTVGDWYLKFLYIEMLAA